MEKERGIIVIGNAGSGLNAGILSRLHEMDYQVIIADAPPPPPKEETFLIYPPSNTKEEILFRKIYNHINGKRSLRDEYNLIIERKSTLTSACRKYLLQKFEEQKTRNNGNI
jgi:MinD-like ATPase involved in chromosome partitioning or flagellar assembly